MLDRRNFKVEGIEGGTFSHNGELLNLKEGYIVGITKALATGLTAKERFTFDDINKLMEIEGAIDGFIGYWKDSETGLEYWDIVVNLKTKDIAIDYAKSLGELAIWDCANQKEIRV